jgi:hypothetical protein
MLSYTVWRGHTEKGCFSAPRRVPLLQYGAFLALPSHELRNEIVEELILS